MKCWKIKLKINSPSGTPWHSDTIFGHLCWQVVYGVLDFGIDEFLLPFRNGNPPFILSDGFPEGYLPKPLIITELPDISSVDEYAEFKVWKKAKYVTFDDFLRFCSGSEPEGNPISDPWISVMTPHASMDRSNLRVADEGGFHETISHCLADFKRIDVYIRADKEWMETAMLLFASVSKTGFGRDKSTGLGEFEVCGYEEVKEFDSLENPTGFVSLSSMIPSENDPTDARFRLRTKFGKLGEGIFKNPFKKPLLQMEPGAVFFIDDEIKPFYGCLINDIAPGMPEAVQNCYGLAVPCRSSGE